MIVTEWCAGHPFHPYFALESLLRFTLTSRWTVRELESELGKL